MAIIKLSRKKELSPAHDSSGEGSDRKESLHRVESAASVQSSGSHIKLKTLFKSNKGAKGQGNGDVENTAKHTERLSLDEPGNSSRKLASRPVSTIVENFDDDDDGEFDSDFESDLLAGDGSASDMDDSELELIHTHAIKKHGKGLEQKSQLSTLMGYCGLGTVNQASLTQAANEESKRTFSLLDNELKIHPLSNTTKRDDPRLFVSAIGDDQVAQLNHLTNKLTKILEHKESIKDQEEILSKSRTLYDKYGTVSKVIGRGAYGLIKIIDPERKNESPPLSRRHYAVKELQRRPNTDSRDKETKEKFIERILSEFIISSTLNSRHIVKTIDLMYTLPPADNVKKYWAEVGEYSKISQIMECTPGGDLFTYLTTKTDINNQTIRHFSLDENDCFVKQISRGLWYMHQHGVAHCDLKLENILVSYEPAPKDSPTHTSITLKLSDFGKSNVVQTKWDRDEQLVPYSTGPIGSEPYIAPEEYGTVSKKSAGYSAKKKDNWALGVLILTLFNIQKSLYTSADTPGASVIEHSGTGYVWHSTETKGTHKGEVRYKDKVFDEYVKQRMIADYDPNTKEWLIHRKGKFTPLETLFGYLNKEDDDSSDEDEREFCELRKMLLYSLLDPNPSTRLTVDKFLKSDWMKSVDTCI